MPKREARNPASAKGDWFIDDRCIDCAASREVASGLIVERDGKSVFARQPVTEDDTRAAWRAVLLCPTASVGQEGRREQPPDLFPQEIERGRTVALHLRLSLCAPGPFNFACARTPCGSHQLTKPAGRVRT
jgi:ferredoxin